MLRREVGNVLRIAFDFEVEGERRKWLKTTWRKQVEEESMKYVEKGGW